MIFVKFYPSEELVAFDKNNVKVGGELDCDIRVHTNQEGYYLNVTLISKKLPAQKNSGTDKILTEEEIEEFNKNLASIPTEKDPYSLHELEMNYKTVVKQVEDSMFEMETYEMPVYMYEGENKSFEGIDEKNFEANSENNLERRQLKPNTKFSVKKKEIIIEISGKKFLIFEDKMNSNKKVNEKFGTTSKKIEEILSEKNLIEDEKILGEENNLKIKSGSNEESIYTNKNGSTIKINPNVIGTGNDNRNLEGFNEKIIEEKVEILEDGEIVNNFSEAVKIPEIKVPIKLNEPLIDPLGQLIPENSPEKEVHLLSPEIKDSNPTTPIFGTDTPAIDVVNKKADIYKEAIDSNITGIVEDAVSYNDNDETGNLDVKEDKEEIVKEDTKEDTEEIVKENVDENSKEIVKENVEENRNEELKKVKVDEKTEYKPENIIEEIISEDEILKEENISEKSEKSKENIKPATLLSELTEEEINEIEEIKTKIKNAKIAKIAEKINKIKSEKKQMEEVGEKNFKVKLGRKANVRSEEEEEKINEEDAKINEEEEKKVEKKKKGRGRPKNCKEK